MQWMNNHGARQKAAAELLKAIEDGFYGAQTLNELTQVLDHEYLCLMSLDEHEYPQDLKALWIPWTSKHLVVQLSETLFPSLSPDGARVRASASRTAVGTLSSAYTQHPSSSIRYLRRIAEAIPANV